MSKSKNIAIVNVLIESLKLQFEKLDDVNRKIEKLETELNINQGDSRKK